MSVLTRYISVGLLTGLATSIFLFGISFVYAQPSYTMNYQGKLTNSTGLAVTDGTYAIEFKLYTELSGGTAVWTETRTGGNEVTVQNGLFSVMLGSVTSLGGVNFNQPLYLGVKIEADAEMTPRKALGTVPSAFEAQRVGGVASTSFLRSDQADSASGLLTFTGGIVSTASSSISRLSFTNATGTSLYIGGDSITDFTGSNLSVASGVLNLSASYIGQTSITTLGTVTTGTWQGGIISSGFLDSSVILSSEVDSSAEIRALLSDETGTGDLVFGTNPTFTGNLVTFTSLAASRALFLDSSSRATTTATSAYLLNSLSDETGTGVAVFGTSPTFTTQITTPLIIGGTTGSSQLILRSTSGSGNADDIIMQVGVNGATQAFRIDNDSSTISFGVGAGTNLNANANNNTLIGYQAGYSATSSLLTGSNLIGYRAGYSSVVQQGNVIGYNAGYYASGQYNNILGYYAGQNTTGSSNNLIGERAGSDANGSDSNLIGTQAGYTSSGLYNNLLGYQAGYSNTGSNNNFFGYRAGYSNTGSNNNFFGYRAGYNNTASSTVMIGYRAGEYLRGVESVAIGGETLRGTANFTAANNVAVGTRAGTLAQTGATNNILLGYQAADNLTTGNNNIIIGYDIDNVTASADNSLNIGNLIFGTGLDGTGTTLASGNVGIGTSTPNQRFSVFKNASDAAIEFSSASGTYYKWTAGIDYSDAGKFKISSSSALGTNDRFVIDGNGNITMSGTLGVTGGLAIDAITEGSIETAIDTLGNLTSASSLATVGTITSGTWSSSLANNIITPNSVLTTGQTDEYCLTYESTGTTFEWQSCGTSGLTSIDIDTSSELAAILTDETGTGVAVFGTSPTFTTYVNFGSSGVKLSDDSDGSLTFLGMGDGFDEDLTLNLDDTANTGVFTSSTGLNQITFSNIGINTTAASGYSIFGTRYLYASTTNDSLSLGEDAGRLFNGSALSNIAIGYQAGHSATSSDESVYIGYQSGYLTTSGSRNVFTGTLAGWANTTGQYNTYIGYRTGESNTTGSENTFIGYVSGEFNTSGKYNTYLGTYSGLYNQLGSANVAIGQFAGEGTFTNSYASSTIIGYGTGVSMTTGSGNVLLGYSVGAQMTSGSRNILIGYGIEATSNTLSNQLNIGNTIFGTDVSQLGATVDADAKIGIGTSTPNQKLTIFNSAADAAVEFSSLTGSPYKWTAGIDYSDAGKFKISSSSALGTNDRFVIDGNGNVGISTTSPYAKLSLNGSLALTGGLYDNLATRGTDGMVLQTTGTGVEWVATSTLGISGASFSNSAQLAALISDETGTDKVVFSASPTFTGTINAAAVTLSSTLLMSGSAANIALGSNWLSGDGADEGVYVTSGGYVGVGTSTPASKFVVAANSADTMTNIFSVSSSTAGTMKTLFNINRNGAATINTDASLGDTAAYIFDVQTNGASRFNVNGAGDVQGVRLMFVNSGYYINSTAGVVNWSGDTGFSRISAGVIGVGNGTTGNTSGRLVLSSLGVATTTPWKAFSVAGDASANHFLPNGPYTTNLSGYDLGATNQRWNAVWAGTYNVGTSTWSIKQSSGNRLSFFNAASGSGTEAVSFLSNGNVGIGNTTPSEKLTVNGNILTSGNILPSTPPTISGDSRTATVVDSIGDVGTYTSITLSTDGYPVISYFDVTNNDLKILKCGNAACSSGNTTTAVDTTGTVGLYTSITLSTDGHPVVSYYDATNGYLKILKCGNAACSSGNTTTAVDTTGSVGGFSSIILGTDGYPVVSYYDETNLALKILKCGNAACSSGNTTTTVDSTDVGLYTSITLSTDGHPVVSYYDETTGDLKILKCGNAACSSGNTTTAVDTTGDVGKYTSITLGTDGYPVISYHDVGSSDLKILKCGNAACSSGNTTTAVDSVGSVGVDTSIILGTEGHPVVSYYDDTNNDLKILKCGNASCSSGNTTTAVDSVGSLRADTSITLSTDGYPVVSYHNETTGDLKVLKCADHSCSSSTGNYTSGSSIGNIGSFFNNIYAQRFWGKNFTIANFDLAESYEVREPGALETGDVVAFDADGKLVKAGSPEAKRTVGIISTAPGILLSHWEENIATLPVALAGRVPVKVSTTSDIVSGDMLTLSEESGVARKAKLGEATLGTVIRVIDQGQVEVMVRMSEADPLTQILGIAPDQEAEGIGDTFWNRIKMLAENFADGVLSIFKLKAERVEVQDEFCIDGTCIDGAAFRAILQGSSVDGQLPEDPPEPETTSEQNTEPDLSPDLLPPEPAPDPEEDVVDELVEQSAGSESETPPTQ